MKTLKDIEQEGSRATSSYGAGLQKFSWSDDLRNAAREHVKQMEIVLKRYDSNENEHGYLYGKMDWIKHFFNLE